MHYATAAALFNVTNLDATTIQRMPSIVDFKFLPDMGRMSANWIKPGNPPNHEPISIRLRD